MAKKTSPTNEQATEDALSTLKVARRLVSEISHDIGDEVQGMRVGLIGTQGQLPLSNPDGKVIGLIAIQIVGSPLITKAALVEAIDCTVERVKREGITAVTGEKREATVIPMSDDNHDCVALKCHPGETCDGEVLN